MATTDQLRQKIPRGGEEESEDDSGENVASPS